MHYFWSKYPTMFLSTLSILSLSIININGAYAQVRGIVPPEQINIDEHSVDLSSGRYVLSVNAGSVGPKDATLSFVYYWGAFGTSGRTENNFGYLSRGGEGGGVNVSLIIGASTTNFSRNIFFAGDYTRLRGAGGVLTESANGQSFTYYTSNGTKYLFGIPANVGSNKSGYCEKNSQISSNEPCILVLLSVIKPDGNESDIDWEVSSIASNGSTSNFARIKMITNNRGYRATYSYATDNLSYNNLDDWYEIHNVSFTNLTNPDQELSHISLSLYRSPWPVVTLTDTSGQDWVVTQGASGPNLSDANLVTNVHRQNGLVTDTTITYGTRTYSYGITSIIQSGQNIYYNTDAYGDKITTVRTDGNGNNDSFIFTYGKNGGQPISHTDGLNRVTRYETDLPTRNITKVTFPEGNSISLTYVRDKISFQTNVGKPGSGDATITSSASYSDTCGNPVTCNLPASVTDARGNVTSYVYDQQHGGLLIEIRAADANGIHPVTRYTYVQRYAWIASSGGSFVHTSSPVWLLSQERTCRSTTTAANATGDVMGCAGGASDEVVTRYDYGPDTGSVGNNLLLRGKVVTAQDADGVIRSYRTCYGYDALGNKIWETSPRAGLSACY